MAVEVGSTVWVYDGNHRVYKEGRGGPVWREHWVPRKIAAATTRSWVMDRALWVVGKDVWKIPKHGPSPWWVMFSQAQVDDAVWVHEHANRISEAVQAEKTPSVLRQIAQLVGYREER